MKSKFSKELNINQNAHLLIDGQHYHIWIKRVKKLKIMQKIMAYSLLFVLLTMILCIEIPQLTPFYNTLGIVGSIIFGSICITLFFLFVLSLHSFYKYKRQSIFIPYIIRIVIIILLALLFYIDDILTFFLCVYVAYEPLVKYIAIIDNAIFSLDRTATK